MRARDFAVPAVLLGGIAAFMVAQSRNLARDSSAARPAQQGNAEHPAPHESAEPHARTVIVPVPAQAAAPKRDSASVASLITNGSPGTYLPEMLDEHKGFLVRWPERREPLRVWIERDRSDSVWSRQYPIVAERAFSEWREAGFPLRFDIVHDSASADIAIRWTAAFPPAAGQQIGVARNTRDANGWMRRAEITVAFHDWRGRPLTPETVGGAARHEIGHALGLGHSSSPSDVMHATAHTNAISAADRATLHLLYLLPPGKVR